MSLFLDKINGLTIGIRYARSFRVPDISGEIVDNILYSTQTPFGQDFFTNVADIGDGKILSGPNNAALQINTDDLILNLSVNNFEKTFSDLTDKFIPFISELLKNFSINNVRRLGIVYRHKLENTTLLDNIVKDFSKTNIDQPNSVRLSFSKKLEHLTTANKDTVNDYKNVIFTFEKNDGGFFADLDYQLYFKPQIEDLRDGDPRNFVIKSRKYLIDQFYTWLKTYETKTQ